MAGSNSNRSDARGEPTADQLALWESRKAPRSRRDIPAETLKALNAGWIESRTLVEWLSVDRVQLFLSLAKRCELSLDSNDRGELQALRGTSALKQSWGVAHVLSRHVALGDNAYLKLVEHRSDIVREWCALLVGLVEGMKFSRRLAWIKTFADDRNSAVRELAWMGLRQHVTSDPVATIGSLVPWTGSRNERLRRFASEVTRPRGVWCEHIPLLRDAPELGLPILEPLRSDSSLYVRNSVANWLNDASKTAPQWVIQITSDWLKTSTSEETEYIVRRARRTLEKGATTRPTKSH
ncbi:MAG: DNA alkylation repair protein [Planctomycetes bacterium]|nr:DNA alkylation repair protein [Planctomycetota bacterium]